MVFSQLDQDELLQVAKFWLILGVHQDNQDKAPEVLSEHLVHEPLENGGGIDQFIQHHSVFIVASMGHKGGLPLVLTLYPDKVVRTVQVKCDEYCHSMQQLQGSQNKWK